MDIDVTIGNDVTMRGGASASVGRIDQYELVRELGGGGFGCVYLAKDTVAGIEVAVKGLPPEVRHNKEELENIRANFALVSRLHHPNIAAALVLHPAKEVSYANRDAMEKLRVFERDTMMVMEYAPGVTLSQWRKQFPEKKVPLEKALDITRQVAAALDYAHAEKIVHRDVKPSNVMIETKPDGSVVARVLDFGLAAEIRSSMGRVSREIRDTSGTRPYMAPEQWRGAKQGPATDQYALAAMFCELVTGEVPFASVFDTGDPVLMKTAVATDAPEFSKELPKSVRLALAKALAKQGEERFATCGAFVAALGGTRSVASAGKTLIAAALLALLSLVAVGGWWWHERVKSEELRAKNEALAAERARQAEESKRAEVERKAIADAERIAEQKLAEERRIAAEKEEAERKAKAEAERVAAAKAEAERKAKLEAERIAAENRKAEELKVAEERAAETEVFRLSSKAESAHTLIEREDAEVKAFFDTEIRAFENDRRAGNDAKTLSKNVVATNFFVQALAKATVLKALIDGRTGYLRNVAKAETDRKSADQVGAKDALATRYAEAQGQVAAAESLAVKRDFAEAMGKAESASHQFAALRSDVIRVTLGLANDHRNAERWQDCLAAANQVLGWEPDNADALTLTKEAESHLGPKVGDTQTITLPGGATMTFCWCPPGSFMMGSPETEEGRGSDETLHEVSLTQGFWMGKYEVTQRQWESVMGENPSRFKSPTRPVENVSWEDCQKFIQKINAEGRGTVLLPTEAQWEYACRAGTTTPYNFGASLNGDKANCDGNDPYGTTAKGRALKETSPVGLYAPNVWGLCDMHGNVWEWCSDWYADYDGEVTNPTGLSSGTCRVFRGGSWCSGAQSCRSAVRYKEWPIGRSRDIGLRLVRFMEGGKTMGPKMFGKLMN